MATIHFYDKSVCDEPTTTTVSCLAEWIVNNQGFEQLYIWRTHISRETSCINIKSIEPLLGDPNETWHIATKPDGPETWIPLIVSVVIGVASALIMPKPDIPEMTNANKTSNNAIQARSNQPRIDKRLPDIRGREPKAYPDLWSSYIIFSNNKEFEVSLMCLSVGKCLIHEDTVKDGDTLAADIDGLSVEFYNPYETPMNGSTPFLRIGSAITDRILAVRQSNEVDGATLLAPNDDTRNIDVTARPTGVITVQDDGNDWDEIYDVGDTTTLVDFYSFEAVTSEVYFTRHDLSGEYEITAVTPTELTVAVKPGWEFLSTTLPVTTKTYTDNGAPTHYYMTPPVGVAYSTQNYKPSVGAFGTKTLGPFDCSGNESVFCNLVAQSGLYKKKQHPENITVQFEVVFTNKDTQAKQTEPLITMSSNAEDSVQSTFEFSVPFANCTIEITRVTDTDFDFEGNVVDEVKWRDLYFVNSPTVTDFGNVTTILAKTRATDSALRRKDRKLSLAVTGYTETPSNGLVASHNFADVIYGLHVDPYIGRRTAATIDTQNLYDVQQQIIDYFNDPDAVKVGFTFDDDSYRYEDHLNTICGAVNVTPYQVGSKIQFFWEGPQEYSVQQFGHRSKNPNGAETRSRLLRNRDNYDGIELTYKDEITGDTETLHVPADNSATNPDKSDLKGQNQEKYAKVIAYRAYNKLKNERITHEFTALDKARLLAKGQRIDVVDGTREQRDNGYIDEVNGLQYWLSQSHNFAPGTPNVSIVLSKRDGALEGIPVTISDSQEYVTLQHAPSESPYVGHFADRTDYSLSADSERGKLAMIVKSIAPDGDDSVVVSCSNYTDDFYKNDLVV